MSLVSGLQKRLQCTCHQQSSFHWIDRLPRQEKLLDIQTQVTEVRVRIIVKRNFHGINVITAARRKRPAFGESGQHKRRRSKSIRILQKEDRGIFAMILRQPRLSDFHRVGRGIQKVSAVEPLIGTRPNVNTLQTVDRADTHFTPGSPFDHSLKQFEPVEPVGVET